MRDGPVAGRRRVLTAFAAFGGAAVLPALARSPVTLAAALLVVGACSGAVDPAANSAGSAEKATGAVPVVLRVGTAADGVSPPDR